MNDSAFGLTAAIWTADEDAALSIGDRIETGTWFMNRCDYLDPALAWVGVKDSGRGCTLSRRRLRASDAAEVVSSAHADLRRLDDTTLRGNWNYPTADPLRRRPHRRAARCVQDAGHRSVRCSSPIPALAALPMIANAVASCRSAGLACDVFSDVQANPVEANVTHGVAAYRRGAHDGVIAFGGGSALDTGKAIALMVGQTRPIWDFEDREDWYTRVNVAGMAPTIARADDVGHRLGSRPRLGHHRPARSHEEDHLSSADAAGAGDRRSGADARPAAARHRGGRHGRAVAQSRSVLRAVLSPDGRRHRGRRHAADQGMAADRRDATAATSKRART